MIHSLTILLCTASALIGLLLIREAIADYHHERPIQHRIHEALRGTVLPERRKEPRSANEVVHEIRRDRLTQYGDINARISQ